MIKTRTLCREHIVAEFKEAFVAYDQPVVVCEPNFTDYAHAGYTYVPVAEMVKDYSFAKSARNTISVLLADLDGKDCSECERDASAIFVPLQALRYDANGPLIEELQVGAGVPLCKPHAFVGIEATLLAYHDTYDEHYFYRPYGGPGFYVSTAK